MAVDRMLVDTLSLRQFSATLQSRIDDANTALLSLTVGHGADTPALGQFVDAKLTASRHVELHDEFVDRLLRLVDALTAAHKATEAIIEEYRTLDQLNRVSFESAAEALRPVSEALDGDRHHG